MRWTEARIAAELEGRFYDINGICANEQREKARQRAADAIKAAENNTVARIRQIVARYGHKSPQAIIAATAYAHGIGVATLVSKSRTRHIIAARHHACVLMREIAGMSFPSIADEVGFSDHTTAVHACETWTSRGRHRVFAAADAAARGLLGVG